MREAARASCSWRWKAKSRSDSMDSAAVSSWRCAVNKKCKSSVESMDMECDCSDKSHGECALYIVFQSENLCL